MDLSRAEAEKKQMIRCVDNRIGFRRIGVLNNAGVPPAAQM